MESKSTSLPYMPGLDGLRALAVGAVFLYHVGFVWAAGGFLGVETFFVLSGYLITSLLLVDLERYGRVRLGRFWLRRARRLWPALWWLLLGVLFLARGWAPDAWARLREDLPAALTYTTNLLYIFRQIPYFERFGRPPLLQHLWSLAVEEQFYLGWPLLLSGLWGLRLGRGRRRPLAAATLALALASALWMAWQYDPLQDPMRLYYGTDTRAAGFLLGGALATVWPPGGRPRWIKWAEPGGWLGLALLLGLYGRLDEFQSFLYRGGFLLTAAATALVVLAASAPRTRLSKALGQPVLRWVGTRSYAIYLWHWPLVAVFRPGFECPWPLPWCALAHGLATGLLAEVSYRMVEQPIRSAGFRAWGKAVWRQGRGWGTALAALALLGAVGWSVSGLQGALSGGPPPLEAALAAEIHTATPLSPTPQAPDGTPSQPVPPSPTSSPALPCASDALPSQPAAGPQVTVIGDSVLQASVTFDFWAPWGSAVVVDAAPGRNMRDVPALAARLAQEGRLAPVVVLHLGTNAPFDAEVLDRALEALQGLGVQRVFLVNVRRPTRWEDLVNRRLTAGAARWPGVTLLDWHALAVAHPEWFVEDRTHLRYYGAKNYVKFIMERVEPVARALGAPLPPEPTCPAEPTVTPTPKPRPTPTATPTPTPAGLRLTLIGDSIMLSTLPAWQARLPEGAFTMEAAQGRRLAHLLSLVPDLAAQGRLAPVVVIHLGTNGSFSDATFDAVMEELVQNGVQRVYFVNVRSPIRWAPLANRQLAAGVARWPQAELLDWNAYATPHREWFYEDFAHPTPEGAQAYVDFVLQGLGGLP